MDNKRYLSLSAMDALTGMLQEEISGPTGQAILRQWSDFTIDPVACTITAKSRAVSHDSLVGQYIGAVTFPYEKRNLSAIVPLPLIVPVIYPTTFVMLATYLQNTYGVLLEDGEFAVDGNSVAGALSGTDTVDALPDPQTGYVTLRAQNSSGRFVSGSTINVLMTSPAVRVPLTRLLSLDSALDMHLLTDH